MDRIEAKTEIEGLIDFIERDWDNVTDKEKLDELHKKLERLLFDLRGEPF